MQIPGEALLGKLWESLADKAIGNLLKPWQIRREGRAHIDVKRDELLLLAQAERDAEAIRRGEMTLQALATPLQPTQLLAAPEEPYAPMSATAEPLNKPDRSPYTTAVLAAQADAVRKEVNVTKAILHAEEALENDQQQPPPESPSEDWLYRWRDYAASVSSEELQLLWGRVLAGEVKAPGAFSVRFLNFLHNLDRSDAQLISSAMPLVIGDFIARDVADHLESLGLNVSRLLALQELGLLTGVEGLGLKKKFTRSSEQEFRMLLRCHRYGIGLTTESASASIEIPAYVVTGLGQQLARLGNFDADVPYLRKVGQYLKSKGFKVEMGIAHDVGNGMTCLLNAEQL